jgi:peptidoglycan/xylan/chitin deacetylase (PgdA/CDA1 family)
MLPVLFNLHARRWATEGKPGVFGWSQKRDFYFRLSDRLLERGSLRFTWLEWNGQVLACQYGFLYNNVYLHLQEGYEPTSEHWSVGIALRAWSIRRMIADGVREYDFLGGLGRHKADWGAQPKYSKQVQIAPTDWTSIAFCRGQEWARDCRERVGAMMPNAILDARRKWLYQQGRAGEATNRGSEWIRRASAAFYVNVGGPAILRRVRDKYCVSDKTRFPRIALRSRTEPAARILYYHRVNDDNDPFFPAISPRLFEQQMSFLATRHNVVSLSTVESRLQEGIVEPVVAITFDDGYQDNYTNAFPILRRYGLPATIFLTTGSIDSREPLWFERLAEAAKATTRDFLDLEIDIPRRFSFRTAEDRLRSNTAIFGLLRGLTDTDRREWLAKILEYLRVPMEWERTDRMLTWNQIREMKSQGVEFGGHTVTHPFVSKLDREHAVWEVSECKRRIEQEIETPVHHFAYPNGREEDFTDWTGDVIRQAGYRAALTTVWGVNYASTDPLQLRRGGPWEPTAAMFAYKLDWYQFANK